MIQLELGLWGDGTMCLAFWDAMHGKDRIFILREDGTASRSSWDGDFQQLTSVNLVIELRRLIEGESDDRSVTVDV